MVTTSRLVVVGSAIVVTVVVAAAVPSMVVRDLAVRAIPVACVVELSIMTRSHPVGAGVRRARPVSVVPPIVVAHRIPVAPYPNMIGARASWLNPDYTYRWWRADSNSDGDFSEYCSRCQQHQYNQFTFHDSTPFLSLT